MNHTQTRPRRAAGFALPVAVLALVVVGVLVTGGFFMAQQETRIGVASRNGSMAFYIAEQGMNEVMANWSAATYEQIPLWQSDTVTGTITQGHYTISIQRVADRMYFLESEGRVTQGGRLAGAKRRMGVLTSIRTVEIAPQAALTTRGQTRVGGNAAVVGLDSVPAAWSAECAGLHRTDKTGVLTDSLGTISTIGQGSIYGSPQTAKDNSIADSTFLDYGEIEWDDLVDLARADGRDITSLGSDPGNPSPVASGGACTTSNPMNWGEPYRSVSQTGFVPECVAYFPFIYHEGPLRLQGSGRGQGILLVGKLEADGTMSGDLDLRGDFQFMGLILALGTFSTQSASPKIYGAVMAANGDLNREDIIGGSRVQYSSCAVGEALYNNSHLSKARPLDRRSWVDLSNTGG